MLTGYRCLANASHTLWVNDRGGGRRSSGFRPPHRHHRCTREPPRPGGAGRGRPTDSRTGSVPRPIPVKPLETSPHLRVEPAPAARRTILRRARNVRVVALVHQCAFTRARVVARVMCRKIEVCSKMQDEPLPPASKPQSPHTHTHALSSSCISNQLRASLSGSPKMNNGVNVSNSQHQ